MENYSFDLYGIGHLAAHHVSQVELEPEVGVGGEALQVLLGGAKVVEAAAVHGKHTQVGPT